MKNVLFVCTANVCRSPMAKAIFDALAADRGLNFGTESAGVSASEGRTMDENARAALEELGIPAENHRSKQVSETLLEEADLVLVMSPRHLRELRHRFGELSRNAHVLTEYATGPSGSSVPDPHGHTMPAYRASARQLLECVEGVVGCLEE